MEMNKSADVGSYTKQKLKELRMKIQTRENNGTTKMNEFSGEYENMEGDLEERMQNSTDKNKGNKALRDTKPKTAKLVNIEMNKSADVDSYTKQKLKELRMKIQTRENNETTKMNEFSGEYENMEGDLEERMQNSTDKNKVNKALSDTKPKTAKLVNIEMNKSADVGSYTKQKLKELRMKIQTRENNETTKMNEFSGEYENMEGDLEERMQNSTDKNKVNKALSDTKPKTAKLVNIEMNKSADVGSYTKQKLKELRMKIQTRENNETTKMNEFSGEYENMEGGLQNSTDKNKVVKTSNETKPKIEKLVNIEMNKSANVDSYTKRKIRELKLKIQRGENDGTNETNEFTGAYENMDGGLGNSRDKNKILLGGVNPEIEKSENWQNKNDNIRKLEENLEKLTNENIQLKVEKNTNENILNAKVSELEIKLEQIKLEINRIQTEAKQTEDNLKIMNNQLKTELEVQKIKKETLETRFRDLDNQLKMSHKLVEQIRSDNQRMQDDLKISKNNFEIEQQTKTKLEHELIKISTDSKWKDKNNSAVSALQDKAYKEKEEERKILKTKLENEQKLTVKLQRELSNTNFNRKTLELNKNGEIQTLKDKQETTLYQMNQKEKQITTYMTEIQNLKRQYEEKCFDLHKLNEAKNLALNEMNTWKANYEVEKQARMELQEQVKQITSNLKNTQQKLNVAENNYTAETRYRQQEAQEAERYISQCNLALIAHALQNNR